MASGVAFCWALFASPLVEDCLPGAGGLWFRGTGRADQRASVRWVLPKWGRLGAEMARG